jgi:hypothetical protein
MTINGFSKDNFTKENAQRISVIIMTKMGRPPLTPFASLPDSQKTKFNRVMNEYINENLQRDDWFDVLLTEFNRIVNEDILNEDFDPSKQFVLEHNTDHQLLLTEEQKRFLEESEAQS